MNLKKIFWVKWINFSQNIKIKYVTDIEHYSVEEKWAYPIDGKGDCEDFSIAKKHELLKHGIKSNFITCWTETDGYHAVLLVMIDNKNMILDNRFKFKTTPSKLYKWDKMEKDGSWYDIKELTDSKIDVFKHKTVAPLGWINYKGK